MKQRRRPRTVMERKTSMYFTGADLARVERLKKKFGILSRSEVIRFLIRRASPDAKPRSTEASAGISADIREAVAYDHIMDRVRDDLPRYAEGADPCAPVRGEQLERVVEALARAVAIELVGLVP
jgi:hypothetical protein